MDCIPGPVVCYFINQITPPEYRYIFVDNMEQCITRSGLKIIGNMVDLQSVDRMSWDVTEVRG